jgi:hypothetical protein
VVYSRSPSWVTPAALKGATSPATLATTALDRSNLRVVYSLSLQSDCGGPKPSINCAAPPQRDTDLLRPCFALAFNGTPFLFFLFFAASLRGYLRRTPAAEPLSALVLAASVLMAAGIAILAGIAFSLAENYSEIQPAAAQVLNVLGNELFFPVVMGACVFGIAAGLAILRGARLPKWLGWVILVLGVASPTPAAEMALFGLVIWIAVVSILIFLRSAPANAAPSPDAPGALGA